MRKELERRGHAFCRYIDDCSVYMWSKRAAERMLAASLRDWEQGRRAPDAATRSYLLVIARMPEEVVKVLNDAA